MGYFIDSLDFTGLIRPLFFICSLLLFLILGHILAYRKESPRTKFRWVNNFLITALNSIFLKIAVPTGLVFFAAKNDFGLLNLLSAPDILKIIVTVLLLDLAVYIQHVLTHKIDLLWRFHRVHHTDVEFDASTALRFHPFEIAVSFLYKWAWIIVIGGHPLGVLAFEIILNSSALFNHSNFKLGEKFESKVRSIIVTPSMHRVHHSTLDNETRSNYGFFLSIWDRVFGTYLSKSSEDPKTMEVGLKAFRSDKDQRLDQLLIQPFRKS